MQYAQYKTSKKTHIINPSNPKEAICGAYLSYRFNVLSDGVKPDKDHICEKCLRRVEQE